MNGQMIPREARPVRGTSVPWLTIAFFVVLFLLAESDYLYSVHMEDEAWRNRVADLVEHGDLKRRIVFLIIGVYGAVGLRKSGRRAMRPQGLAGWLLTAFMYILQLQHSIFNHPLLHWCCCQRLYCFSFPTLTASFLLCACVSYFHSTAIQLFPAYQYRTLQCIPCVQSVYSQQPVWHTRQYNRA